MHVGHGPAGATPSRQPPVQDRRRPDPQAWRGPGWLRGPIRRPFRVLWRGGLPRLAWVERRHLSAADLALQRLQADLRAELLALSDEEALAMQELLRVEEQLGRCHRAAVQAQRLAASTDSPALADLAWRLRALQPATEAAPAPPMAAAPSMARADSVEVLELSEDAYAQAEQLWASSQPAPLPSKDGDVKA